MLSIVGERERTYLATSIVGGPRCSYSYMCRPTYKD